MTEDQLNAEIGLKIRRARRAIDMTQAQLGKKLGGIATSYICEVEKGRKGTSTFRLYQLQKILGVSLWP